jgi:hypothetical protein
MKALAQRRSIFIIRELVKTAALGAYGFLTRLRREQGHG